MAASNRILSLNIGTQTVSLAEFGTDKAGGLVMLNYRTTGLVADPSADSSRLAQTRIVVSEMMQTMGVKGGRVNYAVPAQSVFTRFVRLPAVAEDQVEQIITFEAQQNVPFPIDEVVWDYQLVGGSESEGKMEVVLVAIKADLLDDINSAVEDSGLRTGLIDVAPMALYNAFRYNYSDIDETALVIDMGARTTNLIFVEKGKAFSRSIPLGGSTITAAIAKDLEEPFGAAEQRKRDVGFVSLGGSYKEPDNPDVARVSKMIRNTMTRLHSEISRSISFYRSQQGGSQPRRIYLCGGSSTLPYMREFFSEKLQVPVEFFNSLRNVSVGGSVSPDEAGRIAHTLGELVGLSLRSVSDCPMELNLRPASVARAQQLAQRQPYLVMAGVCLLLCLLGWWLYYIKAATVKEEVLASLGPKVTELKRFEDDFKRISRDVKAREEQAVPYLNVVEQRAYWLRLIDDLNARLPARNIWITLLEPMGKTPGARESPTPAAAGAQQEKPAVLRIRGLYLQAPAVIDEFVTNLAQSPFFDIDLSRREEFNPVRATQTTTEWAYEYELQLKLKDYPFPK